MLLVEEIDHSKIDFGGSNITSGSLNLTVGADNGSDDIVQVGVNTLTLAGTAKMRLKQL